MTFSVHRSTGQVLLGMLMAFALAASGRASAAQDAARALTSPKAASTAALAELFVQKGDLASAAEVLDTTIRATTAEDVIQELRLHLSRVHQQWMVALSAAGDDDAAIAQGRQALYALDESIGTTMSEGMRDRYSKQRAVVLLAHANVYEKLGKTGHAQGARIVARVFDETVPAGIDLLAVCGSLAGKAQDWPTPDQLEAKIRTTQACFEPYMVGLRAYRDETRDDVVNMSVTVFENMFEFVRALFAQASATDPAQVANPFFSRVLSLMALSVLDSIFDTLSSDARAVGLLSLYGAAVAQWNHITSVLPTLSVSDQRAFVAAAGVSHARKLVGFSLASERHADAGFRGALVSKHLVFEASRQESASMRLVLAGEDPTWRDAWRDREALRRRYAALSIELMREPVGQADAAVKKAQGDERVQLQDAIERADRELRRSSPAYEKEAALSLTEPDDVMKGLRDGDVFIEYVRYRPFSFTDGAWGPQRYGAFVLRRGRAPAAYDLTDAASIDSTIGKVRDALQRFVDAGPGRRMSPSLTTLRTSEATIGALTATLREAIWDELTPALAGATRVYVAPDGDLGLLPLEMLATPTAAGWHYVADDWDLVYLGTGRDLARLAQTVPSAVGPAPNQAVLIGAPAFDATPRDVAAVAAALTSTARQPGSTGVAAVGVLGTASASALPRRTIPRNWQRQPSLELFLRDARRQLRDLGWSVQTLAGKDAVEPAVLSVAAPRLMQFLTDGYLLDARSSAADAPSATWENPLLRSMLLLSGANTAQFGTSYYQVGRAVLSESEARARGVLEQELSAAKIETGDGVLTAYEVTSMNLTGTELVNLTACETGLGEVTADGIIGLRQAFFVAGARSVTMSMWQVPTDETVAQLRDFYHRWLREHKGEEAWRYAGFRAAQRSALRRARSAGSAHPYYWAGSVYAGDPGDLRRGE